VLRQTTTILMFAHIEEDFLQCGLGDGVVHDLLSHHWILLYHSEEWHNLTLPATVRPWAQ